MDSNIYDDIEQDNNPSFYGNQSFLSDPYGKKKATASNYGTIGENYITNNKNPSNDTLNESTKLDIPNNTIHGNNNNSNNDLVNNSIGLSNRISQIINDPHSSLDIISSERLMNSSVIVYSIELSIESTNSIIVKRRYSEFKSLRDNLLKLFPTLIIPPIPEKHSIFNYLINSINNSKELSIIETRKRNFKQFLVDLLFQSNPVLKNCELVHKFLDPNYELCWNNAINEPPINLLPNNLLLANPVNPTDPNGLYSLLPVVNGFEFNSHIDNLNSLKKINDDLHKLNGQINFFKLKEDGDGLASLPSTESPLSNETFNKSFVDGTIGTHDYKHTENEIFNDIPVDLIDFEAIFHQNIKVLADTNKLNNKSIKNFKSLINILIELGGNLNNFSLQIHELSDHNQANDTNELSLIIEKFGSTIDLNFLNFESFVISNLIPNWQEPINQLIQYFLTALQIIKFYKFKLIQFKLLYKLKFNKYQDLMNFNNNYQQHLKLNDLKKLNINSPSINHAIKRIESKQKRLASQGKALNSKKSWYGLFGGNKQSFVLPNDQAFAINDGKQDQTSLPGQSRISSQNHYSPTSSPQKSRHNSNESPNESNSPELNHQYNYKINHIEKELNKLDQLINVVNNDMIDLTRHLTVNFQDFLVSIEKKWMMIMLEFVRSGKQLFSENLSNWNDLRDFIHS